MEQASLYKKMAGTSAVFVFADNAMSSPVERDGMVWSGEELHLGELAEQHNLKPAMANALSLEGLEDYDPPQDGDLREVQSFGCHFVYLERTHSWIQVTTTTG